MVLTLNTAVQRKRIFRVRSIGKSGFRFSNPDFGFAIEREIRKQISVISYLFLDFRFYHSIGKSEKKEIHEIRNWISELKSTLRTDFSEVKSVFGFRVRLQRKKSGFQNLNPDFPIERNLTSALKRQLRANLS